MVEQRDIFKVPINQRKKWGHEAMALWIATAKLILNTTMNSGQKTIIQCINVLMYLQPGTKHKIRRKGKKTRLKTNDNDWYK